MVNTLRLQNITYTRSVVANSRYSAAVYSNMTSGDWSIIIQSPDSDFAVERVFSLTVGVAEVVIVTVRTQPKD